MRGIEEREEGGEARLGLYTCMYGVSGVKLIAGDGMGGSEGCRGTRGIFLCSFLTFSFII